MGLITKQTIKTIITILVTNKFCFYIRISSYRVKRLGILRYIYIKKVK
jgi:hypothetical protein